MRGKQSICLFCKHAAHVRSRIDFPKRLASVPSAEPYVLPRLVIDLDAADSTFVRKVDNAPVPEDSREKPRRRRDSFEEEKVVKRTSRPKAPLRPLKVQPIDLWAYGLLGVTDFTEHPNSQNLRHIVSNRAIFSVDSADTVVKEILSAFYIDPSTNLQRAGYYETKEPAIAYQIRKVNSFPKLRRIISFLSSTTAGCRFLAANGVFILAAIREARKAQNWTQSAERVPTVAVLDLFNNLQINLESKGLLLGPELCNAALYYASKSYNIAAVKKYLELLRTNNYAPDWRARKALLSIISGLINAENALSGEQSRRETMELITGWPSGLAPKGGELRSTSFAYLSYLNTKADIVHTMYPAYILGLGELGLSGQIYAEFMAEDPRRMDHVLLGDEHLRFRAQMFAIALLLAKDEQLALQVLESVPASHKDATCREDKNTLRTWRPNSSPITSKQFTPTPKSSNVWLLTLLRDHYSFHLCRPTPQLKEHLARTLVQLPHDPHVVLMTLKSLLLLNLDLPRLPIGSAKDARKYITWAEVDGEEGIQLFAGEKSYRVEGDSGAPTF
ncbi:hypothetical protein ONS96_011705 [Cadophora gregata f. sp. sojae]|nr:hypothetical protein ONS96_011705 [Cadophora gregata f. sp. sojae]